LIERFTAFVRPKNRERGSLSQRERAGVRENVPSLEWL
jgi:hypothetical protein